MMFKARLAAFLAVAAILAGCGGSSKPTTAAGTTPTSGSSSATTTSSGAFASGNNCAALVSLAGKYVQELASAAHGGKFNLGTALKADQALANASPPAIHSDAEYVVHTLAGFEASLTKIGFTPGSVPSPSQFLHLEGALHQLHAARFEAAASHVKSWVAQNCHG